jgi:hypothetical protein
VGLTRESNDRSTTPRQRSTLEGLGIPTDAGTYLRFSNLKTEEEERREEKRRRRREGWEEDGEGLNGSGEGTVAEERIKGCLQLVQRAREERIERVLCVSTTSRCLENQRTYPSIFSRSGSVAVSVAGSKVAVLDISSILPPVFCVEHDEK